MKFKFLISGLLLSLCVSVAQARFAAFEFDSKQQEQDYKELTHELRCLVCQNQNIADSNAELAQDLKRKTYDLVKSGKSKQEITDYMTERYGDFVMYRPPVTNSTLLLWAGPFIILLIGLVVLVRVISKRRKAEVDNSLTAADKSRAEELLKGD